MANRQDFINWFKVARRLPLPQVDTSEIPGRSGRYGELYTQSLVSTRQVLAEEGTYFSITNPTPGTAIAYGSSGTNATFSDTVPFLQILNTANPGDMNAPIVYPDYIKLAQLGTAPASTTSVRAALKLDNGFRVATAGTPGNQRAAVREHEPCHGTAREPRGHILWCGCDDPGGIRCRPSDCELAG